LAFVHVRYLDWAGQETAGVDIFRFNSDGKVVEHWVAHTLSLQADITDNALDQCDPAHTNRSGSVG